MTQRDKAERFRALHQPGNPVVLPNAWDAATARVLEKLGFPAIATSSAAVAFLEGYPDGQHISRDLMLAGVARVARVVAIPVTADLESGYGEAVEDAAATARGAIAAGAIGLNFEDYSGGAHLIDAQLQVARIRAIRAVADAEGVPLVINARTDPFLSDVVPEAQCLSEAISRGRLYRAAGADCIFVPGIADAATIEAVVHGIDAPINVLAGAHTPPLDVLKKIGVARVSLGSGTYGVALAAFRDAALAARDGSFQSLGARITHAETNALFEPTR